MNKKSIILVIFAALLLSGCSADTETIISSSDIGDTISTSTAASTVESGVEDWEWESEEVTVPGDVEFEIDEDNQIQGVTSTTTVTITPDIEIEDTDIEVGVFDEDDIKVDVNAGISNDYGKVGNYTNTSYNEEWGRLGAADPLGHTTYFADSQFDDLMKFVKSGYLPCSTNGNMIKDPRIASRAGGVDNPRLPWWTDVNSEDELCSAQEIDACWLVVTKDAKITQDVEKLIEDENATQEEYDRATEALYGSDMCPGMEVAYSARNYCGDIVRIHVGGNEINWSGKTYQDGEVANEVSSVAGIDFKVECKEDPSAIRLLTAEESRNYLVSTGYGGGAAAKFWNDTRELVWTKSLDTAEYATESFYDKDDNLITAGYIATKPGIFTCTVTNLANGDTVDIVIENLPVHYKELKWGCSTQREMDLVTGYYLNNPNYGMIAGSFNGLASLSDRDSVGMPVWVFNNTEYKDINGKVVTLKETKEAEWFTQHIETSSSQVYRGYMDGVYNGFSTWGFLQTGMGECEANAAQSQTHYELAGITSRYVGNSTHGWLEIKVPASIAEDGQDHWLPVDYHNLRSGDNGVYATPTWRSNEVEGWDYWK